MSPGLFVFFINLWLYKLGVQGIARRKVGKLWQLKDQIKMVHTKDSLTVTKRKSMQHRMCVGYVESR